MRASVLLGALLAVAGAVAVYGQARGVERPGPAAAASAVDADAALVDEYCAVCHDEDKKSGGFSFEALDLAHPGTNAAQAEKVILKIRTGLMPPAGRERPDAAALQAFASSLASRVDAESSRDPGRPLLHRLNRTEYHNAVRDLLDLDIDTAKLLPVDNVTQGFDNMSEALTVTPTLMDAYASAAGTIARLAVGDPAASVTVDTYRLPTNFSQTREIRDAVAAGSTIAIVPTGGTEKNGFHMAMGKHNFHVRAGAAAMATKLGTALVAPVLQYVPEGQATVATPGVLSCARDCFEHVVGAVAGSLKALGFKEVLLVGDNGGNQAPLGNVAALLNTEWDGSGARAFALTDFYDKGHEYQDAWFLGQFGWDESVVGSHAGIKDTSQLLYVKPEDVRADRIADSFNNRRESGISGDPTKATAEFGRVAIEFKANAAIAQYRALKARPAAGGAGDRPARRGPR